MTMLAALAGALPHAGQGGRRAAAGAPRTVGSDRFVRPTPVCSEERAPVAWKPSLHAGFPDPPLGDFSPDGSREEAADFTELPGLVSALEGAECLSGASCLSPHPDPRDAPR